MPQVTVMIAGRSYRMACGEGEEAHLEGLAALYDGKIQEMREAFGEIGDMRLHVMAALTLADERRAFVEGVFRQVEARGPLSARELAEGGRGRGSWWGWSDGKRALEFLFWAGRVTTASRRGFERVYDLPERVLPAEILALPTPEPEEAQRALLRIAARALGVATAADLRDYFRLDAEDAKARIPELVEAGALVPVEVRGWRAPAYIDPSAKFPRRVEARALVSPFDP